MTLPRPLLEKIEQVVRLIRSKGVGVYFVTQNPLDVPDTVLGQLGNRVQHALRAFTPRDQKAVKAAAETFRTNPKLDVERPSPSSRSARRWSRCSMRRGTPGVGRARLVCRRAARSGRSRPTSAHEVIRSSVVAGHYEKMVDRESAYEILNKKAAPDAPKVDQSAEARRAEFKRQRRRA